MTNSNVLHSALPADAIADVLLQSLEMEVAPRWAIPWFIAPWVTRPAWNGASSHVVREVHNRTFRLERRDAGQFSPTFYGNWEAEHSGTKIEGYFGLPPLSRKSLKWTLVVMAGLWAIGIVLNLLDLTVGTHFTVDPDFGLVLSIVFMLFTVGGYITAQRLGSRRDASSLAYLEQKLVAFVETPVVRTDRNCC